MQLAPSPSIGLVEDRELLLFICTFLQPRELGRLACVSRGFGCAAACVHDDVAPGAQGAPEMRSLVEETARRWVQGVAVQQRRWDSQTAHAWPSWLRWMHAAQTCVFLDAHESIVLSRSGSVATVAAQVPPGTGTRCAASGTVLQYGQHFAVFVVHKLRSRNVLLVGVVAANFPGSGSNAELVDGHCFFSTRYGRRYPGFNLGGSTAGYNWAGRQGATNGDRIGLLLDTVGGSLSVFKNGEYLGVMQASGLTGPYRWAVAMRGKGDSVQIEPAPTPSVSRMQLALSSPGGVTTR
eukprot:COSAG01_NODE_13877_length_1524_cov_1.363509_1_plen_294_part_00